MAAIVRRYLRECPEEIRAPFAHHGEVRMLLWAERPGPSYVPGMSRRVYIEEQAFFGAVQMVSRRARTAKSAKPRMKLH